MKLINLNNVKAAEKKGHKWTKKVSIYEFAAAVDRGVYTNLDGWGKLIHDNGAPFDLLDGETIDPSEIGAVIKCVEDMTEEVNIFMEDVYIDWITPETM